MDREFGQACWLDDSDLTQCDRQACSAHGKVKRMDESRIMQCE